MINLRLVIVSMIKFNPNRAEQLRVRKGLTRGFLASECDITSNYLSLLMNGHRIPSLKVIRRMAETLSTNMDYLMNRSNDSSYRPEQAA